MSVANLIGDLGDLFSGRRQFEERAADDNSLTALLDREAARTHDVRPQAGHFGADLAQDDIVGEQPPPRASLIGEIDNSKNRPCEAFISRLRVLEPPADARDNQLCREIGLCRPQCVYGSHVLEEREALDEQASQSLATFRAQVGRGRRCHPPAVCA